MIKLYDIIAKFEEIFVIGTGILLSVVLLIAILPEFFCN